MRKTADITTFQVNTRYTPDGEQEPPVSSRQSLASTQTRRVKTKGFQVTPEAAQQFEILKAESGQSGPALIAEALRLLFQKYGKSPAH